ncbi:hypothetical protein HMPREF1579_01329 [Gardnerella vaginalis JCP8066]|nr:hypothetical protein HMPREF1579_01329 [Gardnerella vaginalis JCP8066]
MLLATAQSEETAQAQGDHTIDHTIAEATEESKKTLEQNTRFYFGH